MKQIQDSLRIATGCQDGQLRIYNTPSLETPPTQCIVAEKGVPAYSTKVLWSSHNTILIGARSGGLQLWDLRENPASGPSKISSISGDAGFSIVDLELNPSCSHVLAASGRHVRILVFALIFIRKIFRFVALMQMTSVYFQLF